MRNKLFKLFLLIIVSCNNKITSSEEDNKATITKGQILSVLESLNKFEVSGETWDFSTIKDLSKFHDYKDIYNSVQLTSSAAGNASVNELIKKLKTEIAPKLDAIGIYFPEDVTTLWGDPNSTRPLHIWFKISIKDGYKADSEIEQLFGKDLMIIFITKGKWVL